MDAGKEKDQYQYRRQTGQEDDTGFDRLHFVCQFASHHIADDHSETCEDHNIRNGIGGEAGHAGHEGGDVADPGKEAAGTDGGGQQDEPGFPTLKDPQFGFKIAGAGNRNRRHPKLKEDDGDHADGGDDAEGISPRIMR